jgi:hypothetical protein
MEHALEIERAANFGAHGASFELHDFERDVVDGPMYRQRCRSGLECRGYLRARPRFVTTTSATIAERKLRRLITAALKVLHKVSPRECAMRRAERSFQEVD